MDFNNFEQMATLASDLTLPKNTRDYVKDLFAGKTIQEIDNMDAISEWEKAMGKNHKTNNKLDDLSMLGFVGIFNKEKNVLLTAKKEIHSSMTFDEFIKLMQQQGFKIGYQKQIKFVDTATDTEAILYDEENGFLIYTTSYLKGLNNAMLYGEIGSAGYKYQLGDEDKYPEVKRMLDYYVRQKASYGGSVIGFIEKNIISTAVPDKASCSYVDSKAIAFSFDMRKCAIAKLDKLKNNQMFGRPIKNWHGKDRLLWFTNSTENTKNHKLITDLKIRLSAPAVAKIINDPERLKTKSSENFNDNFKEL